MDTTPLLGALQRNGLTFTFIITSDEEQRYKPDPSLFQRAVRYLGLPAANVLHVGSSYAEDIVGASLTGMPALLMQRPGAPEEPRGEAQGTVHDLQDRKSTRLNSSHLVISYAVFCLKKKHKYRRQKVSVRYHHLHSLKHLHLHL